jgi:hypothetical protein
MGMMGSDRRSLITIHGWYKIQRSNLGCDHFVGDGVVGTSRGTDGDRSYTELFPTSPVTRTRRGENIPPPAMADVEGGRNGYAEEVQLNGTVDMLNSVQGIK